MIALMLASVAIADPPATVYVKDGRTATAHGPSFIVHELRMDELLALAKSVPELETKIDEIVAKSAAELAACRDSLSGCQDERDSDAVVITDHMATIARLEEKNRSLKTQRTAVGLSAVASLVASGVIAWQLVNK
jgi:hypothetical protein